MNKNSKVLTLHRSGVPNKWVPISDAVEYYSKDRIAWEYGIHEYTMVGGVQRSSGVLSTITTRSIIAIKGTHTGDSFAYKVPPLGRRLIFARDQHICTYCGGVFEESKLELEHIVPVAQGGLTTWTNIITSCIHCNDYKGNRTPQQADMPLRYLPYTPSRAEVLIFVNNTDILDEQREYLMTMSKGNILKYPRLTQQQ